MVLSIYSIPHLILIEASGNWGYYLHFTDKKTEAPDRLGVLTQGQQVGINLVRMQAQVCLT